MTSFTLSHDESGAGAPLVLLHGFPLDASLWAPQASAFASRCRCITPDLRGFGKSPVEPPFSIDQYADDVAVLLDRLGVASAVVGGLSMGGYVALALWRRHPDRVRALLLADTKAGADTDDTRAKRRHQIDYARAHGSAALAEQLLPGMLGGRTSERQPHVVATVRAMLAAAPVEGIVGGLEAMMTRPDSTPTLATIDVPTVVIVGSEDSLTPVAEANRLHLGIAGSRLEVIAGAGHLSNLERPAAFNHVLNEFLDRAARA